MSSINSVRIVLQNEFSVANGNSEESVVKTSAPNSCTVFTLYNPTNKIGILAHVDDYTCVYHSIKEIGRILQECHKTPLRSGSFTAKILGGSTEIVSQEQQRQVLKMLNLIKIPFEIVCLPMRASGRPQIAFDAKNGEISLLKDKEFDLRLEYLQKREYGEWNNFLDRNYASTLGHLIPYFEIKQATRFESNIPKFEVKSFREAQILEHLGRLRLPLQPERKVAEDKKDVLDKLIKLIPQSSPDAALLLKSLKDQNFDLMLRQTAVKEDYISLLDFLLNRRFILNIDVTARGAKSGTALDVAIKFNNQKAIDLLKMC